MTTLQEYRCEIRGSVTHTPNHWFVIQCSDAELSTLKWSSKVANAPGARHFYGGAHAQIYIKSVFNGEQIDSN